MTEFMRFSHEPPPLRLQGSDLSGKPAASAICRVGRPLFKSFWHPARADTAQDAMEMRVHGNENVRPTTLYPSSSPPSGLLIRGYR